MVSHLKRASVTWPAFQNQKQFGPCGSRNFPCSANIIQTQDAGLETQLIWELRVGMYVDGNVLQTNSSLPVSHMQKQSGMLPQFIHRQTRRACKTLFQLGHDVFLFPANPPRVRLFVKVIKMKSSTDSPSAEKAETTARLPYLVMSLFPPLTITSLCFTGKCYCNTVSWTVARNVERMDLKELHNGHNGA